MQFIESSYFGVRAALYELSRNRDEPQFLIVPMIHVGSPGYYQEVRRRLEQCDMIVFEGVRSFRGRILALSYSIVARRKRLGLVTQREALPLKSFRAKLVHADVSTEEFTDSWMRVPWTLRAAICVIAPLYGVFLYLTATRRSLGKRLSTEDLRSSDDILGEEHMPGVNAAIVDRRDRKIVESVRALAGEKGSGTSLIGVIYGAGHMRAIIGALMEELRFRVTKADWVSVFDYDDG